MQNDMIKLNTLLNKEKGTHESLHQDNILLENDFIMALKVTASILVAYMVSDGGAYLVHHFMLWERQCYWEADIIIIIWVLGLMDHDLNICSYFERSCDILLTCT